MCVRTSTLLTIAICHVLLDVNLVGVSREYGEGLEKDFNYGYLMKVNLAGMKCICGTEIQMHNINHAMCVACGMVKFWLCSFLARTSAIMSGKRKATAPITRTSTNPTLNSTWEVSGWPTFWTFRQAGSNDGTFYATQEHRPKNQPQLHLMLCLSYHWLRIPPKRV